MPANASATACDAVGRAIENDGIVLHVPAPGTAVSGEAESLDGGAEFMIATAVDGTVSYPEKDSGLLAGGRVSGPGPCSDGAYNLLYGHGGNVEWYLGDGKRPAGLTTSQTADVLNDAANNITRSYTNCPDLTDTVSATEKYLGVSSHEADMHIDSGDTVCDFWDDGQNVVDFGDLAHNGIPGLATSATGMTPCSAFRPRPTSSSTPRTGTSRPHLTRALTSSTWRAWRPTSSVTRSYSVMSASKITLCSQ